MTSFRVTALRLRSVLQRYRVTELQHFDPIAIGTAQCDKIQSFRVTTLFKLFKHFKHFNPDSYRDFKHFKHFPSFSPLFTIHSSLFTLHFSLFTFHYLISITFHGKLLMFLYMLQRCLYAFAPGNNNRNAFEIKFLLQYCKIFLMVFR